MEGAHERMWMYTRENPNGNGIRAEFVEGVEEFENFAMSKDEHLKNGWYKCPCVGCKNTKYESPAVVKEHLYEKGFVEGYFLWSCHGEVEGSSQGVEGGSYKKCMEAQEALYEGCRMSELEGLMQVLSIKSTFKTSNECCDAWLDLVREFGPESCFPKDMNALIRRVKELTGHEVNEEFDMDDMNALIRTVKVLTGREFSFEYDEDDDEYEWYDE